MPRPAKDEHSSRALSGRGILRLAFLFCIAAAVAALAGAFGIARDYGFLHASILSGSPGGQYHALATRLSERARRELLPPEWLNADRAPADHLGEVFDELVERAREYVRAQRDGADRQDRERQSQA